MTKYVLGFAFSQDLQQVILIQKQKPEFQHGKLNGIGGKVEPTSAVNGVPSSYEDSHTAMIREFREETGVRVGRWIPFTTLKGKDWDVDCFFSIITANQFQTCTTQEVEFIVKSSVTPLPTNCMRNLYWLIPMALNWDAECVAVLYE